MHAVLVPVYLLLITPITITITSSWWASGSQVLLDPQQICKKRQNKRMQELCNDDNLLGHIGKGVRLAQDECQYQFRHRRWNCTTAKRSMKKVLLRDTRETGFVNAITAAGITYAVTRACTMGELHKCSCDRNYKHLKKDNKHGHSGGRPEGDWQWGGCSENVNYGIKKSKEFLDSRYKKLSDIKILVKLHNYAAGRTAIKRYMRTQCKCHGLSGTCTVRTCWKKMPTFREVGDRIKEHFDGAAKVIAGNDGHSFIPEGETIKPPNREDLVYFEESPKYCTPNLTVGSLGTEGRVCNATSLAEEGCDIMCCGRGYRTVKHKESVNCNCEFQWCCQVRCAVCQREYDVHQCL